MPKQDIFLIVQKSNSRMELYRREKEGFLTIQSQKGENKAGKEGEKVEGRGTGVCLSSGYSW